VVAATDSIVVDSQRLGESNVYDAADSNKEVPEIIPEDTTTKRGLWSIFYRFSIRICSIVDAMCFPMIPMTVSFFTKQKQN
jgi:hypothetical protein